MKAFEDWYRRNPKLNLTYFGKNVWGLYKKRDEQIWKAALEWALKTAEELERTDAPVFMNDVIRNELNGNDE